jgi:hypothetical protein
VHPAPTVLHRRRLAFCPAPRPRLGIVGLVHGQVHGVVPLISVQTLPPGHAAAQLCHPSIGAEYRHSGDPGAARSCQACGLFAGHRPAAAERTQISNDHLKSMERHRHSTQRPANLPARSLAATEHRLNINHEYRPRLSNLHSP